MSDEAAAGPRQQEVWVVQEERCQYSPWPSKVLGLYESFYDAQVRASEELATTETPCQVFKMLVHPERPIEASEAVRQQDQEARDWLDLLPEDAKQRITEFHRQQDERKRGVRDMREKKLLEFAAVSGQAVMVGDSLQRLDAIEAELVDAAEKLCNLDEGVDEFYGRRELLMEERSALQAVLMDLAREQGGDYDVQCALQARFSFRTC